MDESYKLKVNESMEFELSKADLAQTDILVTSDTNYHILHDNNSYQVEILESDFRAKEYVVRVNSGVYTVSLSDQLDKVIDEMGFSIGSTKDVDNVEAPMPGLILDINVEAGQSVNENDPLLILEAMKMENVITSPREGVIKNVVVKKGEAVDKKHILIEFE